MAAKPINQKSNKIEPNWKVKQIGRVATSKMSLVDTSSIKSIKIHLMNKERCKKNGIMWEKFPIWGGSDPNPLLDVYLPSYFWHAKMAPNQSCMPLVVKKNGNMWETFPTEGGVTYSQRNCFLWGQNCDFLVKTKNIPEVLK